MATSSILSSSSHVRHVFDNNKRVSWEYQRVSPLEMLAWDATWLGDARRVARRGTPRNGAWNRVPGRFQGPWLGVFAAEDACGLLKLEMRTPNVLAFVVGFG